MANIDFIFTIVKSLFVFFSFSSSCRREQWRIPITYVQQKNCGHQKKKYSQPPIFFSCSYRGWPTLREPPFSSPAFCSASQSRTWASGTSRFCTPAPMSPPTRGIDTVKIRTSSHCTVEINFKGHHQIHQEHLSKQSSANRYEQDEKSVRPHCQTGASLGGAQTK